jgi:hypothetical protein
MLILPLVVEYPYYGEYFLKVQALVPWPRLVSPSFGNIISKSSSYLAHGGGIFQVFHGYCFFHFYPSSMSNVKKPKLLGI